MVHFMHLFSPWQNTSKLALPIWLNENVRFLAMAMTEQAHHCSSGLTKTFVSVLRVRELLVIFVEFVEVAQHLPD